MQLIITIKKDSVIEQKGSYYRCYCGSMQLGTLNLIAHILAIKECGSKFTDDLVTVYPPPVTRKWWQKFRKQKKLVFTPPTLFLPGIKK